jgi:hypothetical protein
MKIIEIIKYYKDTNANGQKIGNLFKRINKDLLFKTELESLTTFLNQCNPVVSQRFYHIWYDDNNIHYCYHCESHAKFNMFSLDKRNCYYGTCGNIICHKKYIVDRTKEEVFKKYGVENIGQTQQWKDKIKSTNLERYGVEWQTQSKNFKDKTTNTWNIKYGGHHTKSSKSKDKKIKTNLERYGVEHGLQSELVKAKGRATCLKRYGVEYTHQNIDIFNKAVKSSLSYKKFILPSGRIVNLQGYEDIALKQLLDVYKEDDILIGPKDIQNKIGQIWYINDKDKQSKYYPDFYIISENKIIEVKSEYTFRINYNKNKLKEKACLDNNLNFEFIIITKQ